MDNRKHRSLLAVGMAVLALAVTVGCNDDDEDTPPGVDTYQGGWADSGGGAGSVYFTIGTTSARATRSVLGGTATPVTGEVQVAFGGSPVVVDGFFDEQSGALALSNDALEWAFNGELREDGLIVGTCLTPFGGGNFVTRPVSSVVPTAFYCGTYFCDQGCGLSGENGTFQLLVFGATALAGIVTPEAEVSALLGTVTGSQVSFDFEGVQATGTISAGAVSGTYVSGSESGTWNGSAANCSVRRAR